ncbi:MAG: response regulator [Candidatus Lambdaproteobacteria bacterium]|nr:response regulator [Candidatus Lambdaproteobacteria bacterium]
MKLLIVDDEVKLLKALALHFELDGFEVTTTPDPFEALRLMQEGLYSLVITDIRMPAMSGVDLLKELRRINPLANIFIITGYSNMSYVVECLASGACDYFAKPLSDLDAFIRSVGDAKRRIERWHAAMNPGAGHGAVILQ